MTCNVTVQEPCIQPNTAYIYVLQRNKIDGTRQNQVKVVEDGEATFSFTEDGYYTLTTMPVSKEYCADYYYKKDDKGRYTFYHAGLEVKDIQEIIDKGHTTDYFHLCNIKKCYIALCQEILDSKASVNCNDNFIDKSAAYKRDLVGSAIRVAEYLIEMKQFAEAERLIQRISGCNGLCPESNDGGCGCVRM